MINLNKEEKQLIGTQNGLKIFKKLKAKTKLKAHKNINPVSKKQIVKNRCWKVITDAKFEEVGRICLWCGKHGSRNHPTNPINGHHIERRNGHNNTIKNCYPCHNYCHTEITDKNIDVILYVNREEWEKRENGNSTTN